MRKIFRQKENPINIVPKFNSIQLNFDCDNDNMVKLNFDELKSQVKYSLNEFFDVEIECDGETFNCHQVVLSISSPYFRAMFRNTMTEKRTNKVTLKEVESGVVREMLHFIYTGATNRNVLEEKSVELLAAAERFMMDELKIICEDYLCANLSIDNAIENLVLGDYHQAHKLSRMAVNVIAQNLGKVVRTEEYQDLKKHHPLLDDLSNNQLQSFFLLQKNRPLNCS